MQCICRVLVLTFNNYLFSFTRNIGSCICLVPKSKDNTNSGMGLKMNKSCLLIIIVIVIHGNTIQFAVLSYTLQKYCRKVLHSWKNCIPENNYALCNIIDIYIIFFIIHILCTLYNIHDII